MFTKDHVQRLIADIGNVKPVDDPNRAEFVDHSEAADGERYRQPPDVPVRYIGNRDMEPHQLAGAVVEYPGNIDLTSLEMGEPYMFGLALDAFDPVSGQVFAVTRPHVSNSTEPEIFVTPRQLAAAVTGARLAKMHSDRALGILTPEQAKAREVANEQAKADQQEAEQARTAGGPITPVTTRPQPQPALV